MRDEIMIEDRVASWCRLHTGLVPNPAPGGGGMKFYDILLCRQQECKDTRNGQPAVPHSSASEVLAPANRLLIVLVADMHVAHSTVPGSGHLVRSIGRSVRVDAGARPMKQMLINSLPEGDLW